MGESALAETPKHNTHAQPLTRTRLLCMFLAYKPRISYNFYSRITQNSWPRGRTFVYVYAWAIDIFCLCLCLFRFSFFAFLSSPSSCTVIAKFIFRSDSTWGTHTHCRKSNGNNGSCSFRNSAFRRHHEPQKYRIRISCSYFETHRRIAGHFTSQITFTLCTHAKKSATKFWHMILVRLSEHNSTRKLKWQIYMSLCTLVCVWVCVGAISIFLIFYFVFFLFFFFALTNVLPADPQRNPKCLWPEFWFQLGPKMQKHLQSVSHHSPLVHLLFLSPAFSNNRKRITTLHCLGHTPILYWIWKYLQTFNTNKKKKFFLMPPW